MKNAFVRSSWSAGAGNVATVLNAGLYVDFGGRAGSYKKNVTLSVYNGNKNTGDFSFVCISTSWPFY